MTPALLVRARPRQLIGFAVFLAVNAAHVTTVDAQDASIEQNEGQGADAGAPPATEPESIETITRVEQGDSADESSPSVRWIEEPTEPVIDDPRFSGGDSETIPQGPRYVLERILIRGNRKTLRQVILHYIEMRRGEVFSADDVRLEKARYRMLASGLFHDVEISLKRGSQRGYAIVIVEVKERNTIVVQDIVFGFSEITPAYGSLDVAERSFLGTGVNVSAAAVVSKEQYGYRLRFGDDHFLNSDFGLHAEGLYSHARDFFGRSTVCVSECEKDPETGNYKADRQYAVMNYNRAGLRLGTGYTLLGDNYFSVDYRFEVVQADVPPAASHKSFGEQQPIVFGHLLPGHSVLSSLILGVVRDTRDSFILASEGSRTAFEVELATEVIGSDYDFSKFTLAHDVYFPLGKGHAIKLGLFGGLILGNAPFFDQFFVGDFSAFIPSRVLEMNFSHLQPSLLDTTIKEMRYENLAASIGVQYSIPFYRGHGFFYGVNGFVGLGLFFLASREDLKTDPRGYEGYEVVPMDLTADLGIKVDTEIGLFVFSLANLFRLIPHVGDETAEE